MRVNAVPRPQHRLPNWSVFAARPEIVSDHLNTKEADTQFRLALCDDLPTGPISRLACACVAEALFASSLDRVQSGFLLDPTKREDVPLPSVRSRANRVSSRDEVMLSGSARWGSLRGYSRDEGSAARSVRNRNRCFRSRDRPRCRGWTYLSRGKGVTIQRGPALNPTGPGSSRMSPVKRYIFSKCLFITASPDPTSIILGFDWSAP
jgi:hypothetical protein